MLTIMQEMAAQLAELQAYKRDIEAEFAAA
jgi:hypothetical protein